MASPFQKYQSGIEASTGNLVSAYGQMAAQTSNALTGLGQNLADGIKNYAKNQAEDELLTAKAQGLGGNFEFLTKQIRENPELAPFADSFNPILKKIGKFSSMSRGQKQALLLEAEAFQAQIAPALAIYKEGNLVRVQQGVQSALSAKVKATDKKGFSVDALPYQPDKSPDWNFENNRKHFQLAKDNTPNLSGFDIDSALGKLADGWSTAFASDAKLGQTDPKFRDTIIQGISDWSNLRANTATTEDGATDYAKEADYYAGTTTASADAMRQQMATDALAKQRASGTSNENIEQILEERIKTAKTPAYELDVKLNTLGSQLIEESRKKLDEAIKSDSPVNVSEILDEIKTKEKTLNPTASQITVDIPGFSGIGAGMGRISPTRTETVVNTYSPAAETITKAAVDAGINIKKNLNAEEIAKLRKALSSTSEAVVKQTAASEKKLEAVKNEKFITEPDAEAVKKAQSFDLPFNYDTKIQEGIETTARDMTYAEEKEFVRQWFVENRKGVIPSTLDAVYKSIRPETDVQFMPAPDGGQVMITSKGAQYIPPVKGEVVSDKARSERGLYNYGRQDPATGRFQFEERIKGSGILLAGFVSGGEKKAQDFDTVVNDVAMVRRYVPELKELFKKTGHSIAVLNQADYGKATSLIAKIKAAIRVETVGTGPVALPEHQMIQERIGDPREFFALDKISIDKLDTLLRTAQETLQSNSAGISVQYKPTAGDVSGLERQARIQANKSR
jgi:hypothetical protein